jgi:hypothetical protein
VSPTSNQGFVEPSKRAPQDEQPRDNAQVTISRPANVKGKDSLPLIAAPIRGRFLYALAESVSSCAVLSSSESSSEDSSDDPSDDYPSDDDGFFICAPSTMARGRRTSSTYTGYSTPYEEEDSFSDDESLAKVRARRSSSTQRQPPAHSLTSQSKQQCRSNSTAHAQSRQRRCSFIDLQQEQQQQKPVTTTPEDGEQTRRRREEARREKLARHESEDRKFYEASVAEYKSDDDTARITVTKHQSNKPDPRQEELDWHKKCSIDPEGMLREPVEPSNERMRREKHHKLAACTWMKTKIKPGNVDVKPEGVAVGVPKLVLTDPAGGDWSLKDPRRYGYETWGHWNKRVGRCRAQNCHCRRRTYYAF